MTIKGKSRVMIFVAAFFIATVVLASMASAESLLDRAQRDGIRIGVFLYEPYSYSKADGKIIGADVDVLKHVLRKMGITEFKFVSSEFGALIPGIKSNRIDVISSNMWIRPERCKQIQFSEPNVVLQHSLVVKKGNPHGLSTLKEIKEKGLALGAISGSVYPKHALKAGILESKVSHLPDAPTALAAVKTDRVAALVTGSLSANRMP